MLIKSGNKLKLIKKNDKGYFAVNQGIFANKPEKASDKIFLTFKR